MPGADRDLDEPRACAHGWADHLRAGGTTPWLDWVARGERSQTSEQGSRELPGAFQLELLRRLNAAGRVHPDLAEHVLRRSAPGRGGPTPSLLWPLDPDGRRGRRAGAPVDPALVPAEQLLRVAAGVLTDLVLDLPAPPADSSGPRRPPRPPRRRRRAAGPTFRIEGSPVTAARLRAELAAAGAVEHAPPPASLLDRLRRRLGAPLSPDLPEVVLVVGRPVDRMLFEVWSRRTQGGAARHYGRFVTEWERRADLPPATQLARVMRHWADRIGPAQVHLLTCEHGQSLDPDTVEGILGVRPLPAGGPLAGDPADLPGVVLDVLRRHNAVLALRVPEQELRFHVERLRDLLAGLPPTHGAGGGLGVPQENHAWVRSAGIRLGDLLDRAGYPVHGDTAVLARVATDLPGLPGPRRVLPVMVQVILRVDAEVRAARGRQEESA